MKFEPIQVDFTVRDENMTKLIRGSNTSIAEMVDKMNKALQKMQVPGRLEYVVEQKPRRKKKK